ncbi:hypothetical protein V500_00794 [Pseudogymnoascus sp. VKM F-4518 (FW-2643)]|nr:hypothetical protein V500_00794 [Pseudogymnoascus sp. VKM F-4518 (FW-2643)]
MAKITMRDFVRVICCLHLPADETMEVNTADRQNDNDWMKPASVARDIPGLEAVPESRPTTSPARGIRCGSTAITSHLPSPSVTDPAKLRPRPSNNNQENASTQTYFDDSLGQNSSQTSRHRSSLPTILRVGRAVLSGSATDKRRLARYSQVKEEQIIDGQGDPQNSLGDDVTARQEAAMRSKHPRENTVGERQEAASQYIAYRRGS